MNNQIENKINIAVCYPTPEQQVEIAVKVAPTCNVALAIRQSGILAKFPEIELADAVVGIFSKKVSLDAALRDGDRVEIYRPLKIDPKQARLLRAKRKQR